MTDANVIRLAFHILFHFASGVRDPVGVCLCGLAARWTLLRCNFAKMYFSVSLYSPVSESDKTEIMSCNINLPANITVGRGNIFHKLMNA